jgi:hypothetical protein
MKMLDMHIMMVVMAVMMVMMMMIVSPWGRVLLQKPIVAQNSRYFPPFA